MIKIYRLIVAVCLLCTFMAQTSSVFALNRSDAENAFFGDWIRSGSGKVITLTRTNYGVAPMTIVKYQSTGEYTGDFYTHIKISNKSIPTIFKLNAKQDTVFVMTCNANWIPDGGRMALIRF